MANPFDTIFQPTKKKDQTLPPEVSLKLTKQVTTNPFDTIFQKQDPINPFDTIITKDSITPIPETPFPGPEEPGLQEPFIDPVTAFVGGLGAGATTALNAGLKLLPALGRGLIGGGINVLTEPVIGTATEQVAEKFPALAFPSALVFGALSGATIEKLIEKKLTNLFVKQGTRVASNAITDLTSKISSDLQQGRATTKFTQQIADELQQEPSIAKLAKEAVTPRVERPEKSIAQLGKEALLPPQPGFKKDALELLNETLSKRPPTKIPEKTIPQKVITQLDTRPQFTGDASKVEKIYNDSVQLSKEQKQFTPNKIFKELNRQIVDTSGNVKRSLLRQGQEGKQAVVSRDLIAGATAKASRDFEVANDATLRQLNKDEKKFFDIFRKANRNIEIAKNKPKFIFEDNSTVQDWQESLNQIPADIRPKVEAISNTYQNILDDQLNQLKKAGLLSDESFSKIRENGKFYSPRVVLEHIDPDRTVPFGQGGSKISVPDSGIKKLTEEGTDKLTEMDSNVLLSNVIGRTQNRIFRNRANQALLEVADKIPDNGIVKRSIPGKRAPAGFEKISVVQNGKQIEMLMPRELAKEWTLRDSMINRQFANVVGWLSGNKILKPMATGLNPEFVLSNLPRDIAHIYLTTEEYSATLPKALFQIGQDIKEVGIDAIKRKGSYVDYINEGGGMEFLTHQGQTSKGGKALQQTQKVLGYLGETSEIMTRLALRNRALKNGLSAREATWVARNYLDFSQGGSSAKALDSAIPYFNASIQGTRGIFRAAERNPKVFTAKLANIATLASGLYFANKFMNPKAWDEISDRDKVNNWIVTLPFEYTDTGNTKRNIFLKTPKDQGQRAFATIFENLMAKSIGEEVNGTQIEQSIIEAIPIPFSPSSLPPTVSAMLGYASNKDFWKNEDIWRGPNIETAQEFSNRTPPAFVKLGKLTGLSPERTKFALQQFFTRGNIFTSLTGHSWNILFEGMPEADKEAITEEVILKQPFVRRFAKATDPFNKFQEQIKEANIKTTTDQFKLNREFDKISQDFYDKRATNEAVNNFIIDINPAERLRLKKRHRSRGQIQGIPERRFWLNLKESNPKVRALIYWDRLRVANENEKTMLETFVNKVPGFRSKQFNRELSILKRKGQPN